LSQRAIGATIPIMAGAAPAGRRLGVEELLAIPEGERFHEILDGELVRKAEPSYEHGDAHSRVGVADALGLGGALRVQGRIGELSLALRHARFER
jgi:hypothetical protein